MRSFDAIVVGGGPAGSSCAGDLVRAGLRVAVLDKSRFPRDKCCAGWITPQVLAALDLDLADYRRERTLQPISGFSTGALGHDRLVTRYPEPVSYAIRRVEFDHYLLLRSQAALFPGTAASIQRGKDRWIVAGGFEAPILVGAGGHACPVAHHLNPGPWGGPVITAQELEFGMSPEEAEACPVQPEIPELYFCPDRRGYGWCARKGGFLNVGFGRLRGPGFPAQLAAFQAFLVERRRIPAALTRRWPGHAYRLYARPERKILDDGALLVGDAAGLAHPVSGEGILAAIESGRLAARSVLAAGGLCNRDALATYGTALARRFGDRASGGQRFAFLPEGVVSAIGVRLLENRWFTERVLLDRWFLHRSRAPLAAGS